MNESLQAAVYRLSAYLLGDVRSGKMTVKQAEAEIVAARRELLRSLTSLQELHCERVEAALLSAYAGWFP